MSPLAFVQEQTGSSKIKHCESLQQDHREQQPWERLSVEGRKEVLVAYDFKDVITLEGRATILE